MSKYFYVIFILLIISGCKKQEEIKTEQPQEVKTDTVKEVIEREIYEGIYTADRYTNSFLDCLHPDSLYWVIDESKKLDAKYYSMFEEQSVYNSVIAKVKGDLENTEDLTIAAKYPRTLRVKEVISVEKKTFENLCVPYDFLALGNDPGWTLEISKQENLIEFKLPGEKKSYYFFYKEPDAEDENGMIVYRNHNPIQRYLIEVSILKSPCTDTKTGKEYEYSVLVQLSDDRAFKGCGIKGKE